MNRKKLQERGNACICLDSCRSFYRRRLHLFHLLLVFFTAVPEISAQFYEYGQDAGSIRWNTFISSHYKLIYPRGLDSIAMDFADKLEYYYPFQATVLDHEHRKMPVIIHNESSFSNGVFVWAPKRIEVFTNPDPNGYPQDWMTQLALHEGRHAFQVSKLNQGLSKFLSLFAGEQALGLALGTVPGWYLEGDAVDAETRFSNTGRGRLPSFEMKLKAQLIEKDKLFSYSKATLGSYRDFVPNQYELGYLLVRYGRRTYGDAFWQDLENYAARRTYLLSPSFFSMRKYGVKSKISFYNTVLEDYKDHWKSTLAQREIPQLEYMSREPRSRYTSYRFPQWMNDSLVVAVKTGIDQIPEFVKLDQNGKEKRIFRPGYMNTGRFTYANGNLVWDEWVPDIRWSNRNYSVVRIYNIYRNSVKTLGSGTRYYAPAISKKGDRIAVIEQNTDNTFNLVVLDLEGKIISSAGSPGNRFIQQPEWMDQDTALVVTLVEDTGEALYSYSPAADKWTQLYFTGNADISYPVVEGNHVYFNSTQSGIDNIYRFDLEGKKMIRITEAEFGAFYPALLPGTKKLVFSDYHSRGYRAARTVVSETGYPTDTLPPLEQLDFASTLPEREIIDGSASIPVGEYSPRPYRKVFNQLLVHSWLPLYFDYMNPASALTIEQLPVNFGVTLLSQNLLSTTVGMLGYEYRDNTHYLHTGLRLKGRLPVFDFSVDYGGPPRVYKINPADSVLVKNDRMVFHADVYIPLRLNTGKLVTYFQPIFSYEYTSDIFPERDMDVYISGAYLFKYRIYASSYLRMSSKDILPRAGISFSGGIRNAPFKQYNFGVLTMSGVSLYLPGLLRHQTLRTRVYVQKQITDRFLYSNEIPLPRGLRRLSGMELKLFSADYVFPLVYPDLNIEPLLYLTRIRAGVWTDYLQGKNVLSDDRRDWIDEMEFLSMGIDLLFDFHFLRLPFPISMGGRVAYLPYTEEWVPEFLFSIDVN